MLQAIFQPEISSLESQVNQLQAQIAAAQSRIAALGECELETSGALTALQGALQKISGLAPDAIATLKTAVLNLFSGGDNDNPGNDGDGNQPQPPAPPSGSNGHDHKLEAVLGKDIVEVASNELNQYLENQASVIAPSLNGQFSRTESDLEDDPSETLQGQLLELACQLKDAPKESLKGQAVKLACALEDAPTREQTYVELVQVSEAAIAYQRRQHDGEILAAYIGFKSKTRAEAWGRWLCAQNNIADGFEVRVAKRLLGFKHELKLWGLSLDSINRLAGLNLTRVPDARTFDTWTNIATESNQQQPETQQDAIDFSTVPWAITTSIPSIEPKPQQTYPTIDETDVLQGISLQPINDDLLVGYTVWIWAIVRNNGVSEPQQKAIGRLVEGSGGIEAYRPRSGLRQTFDRTLDAVNYLLNTSDYRADDILAAVELQERHYQPVANEAAIVQAEVSEYTDIQAEAIAPGVIEGSPTLQVGARVEVVSNRHGDELVGRLGKVTASTPVGCVVVMDELTRWYCTDEVVQVKASLPEQSPKPIEDFDVATPPEQEMETVSDSFDFIEIGDWVEFRQNGKTYEVVSVEAGGLKLEAGDGAKSAALSEVKLVFKKPAGFVPF